jgi:hypothetical protein
MKLFLTASLSLFFSYTNAQQQLGFKTGFNLSALEPMNEKAAPYKRIIGPIFGMIYNLELAPNIYLQAEMNYVTHGGKRTGIQKLSEAEKKTYDLPSDIDLYANLQNRITLNYLDVPALLKFTSGNKVKYYVSVGPYISFLLSAKKTSDGESIIYTDDEGSSILKQDGSSATTISQEKTTTNMKHEMKTLNVGMQAGWGFEFKTRTGSFFMETRLSIGAINVQAYPGTNGKTQTTGLTMSGGYLINLK